jgi:uncharacterized protein
MSARLVVSLSGVDDRNLYDCARFQRELAGRLVPLSLLVAPRPQARNGRRRATAWLAEQAHAGAALLVHGYDHTAPAGAPKIGRRAEFAALPAHEAGLRLTAATAVLERLGLSTDLFAPPRWMVSSGTLQALHHRGFALCADATSVHDLRTGQVYRGRVLGFVRSEFAEPWWCRAMVLGATRMVRRGGLLRLAVDAADLSRSGPRRAVQDAIDIALNHGAIAATYRGFCSATPIRGAA